MNDLRKILEGYTVNEICEAIMAGAEDDPALRFKLYGDTLTAIAAQMMAKLVEPILDQINAEARKYHHEDCIVVMSALLILAEKPYTRAEIDEKVKLVMQHIHEEGEL